MVPLSVSKLFAAAQIAPPAFAELLMKLLVPLIRALLTPVRIAPPSLPAELLMKLLVPVKVSIV